MFWFELINLNVNWINWQLNRWIDQIKNKVKIFMSIIKRLKEVQLKLFVEKMLNYKIFAYVFYIQFERNELCNVYLDRRTCVKTMNVSKKTIFKCFKEFKNLNNEDEIYKLSEYKLINHIIELKKNKSFLYDLIYFLLKSKLKILKENAVLTEKRHR